MRVIIHSEGFYLWISHSDMAWILALITTQLVFLTYLGNFIRFLCYAIRSTVVWLRKQRTLFHVLPHAAGRLGKMGASLAIIMRRLFKECWLWMKNEWPHSVQVLANVLQPPNDLYALMAIALGFYSYWTFDMPGLLGVLFIAIAIRRISSMASTLPSPSHPSVMDSADPSTQLRLSTTSSKEVPKTVLLPHRDSALPHPKDRYGRATRPTSPSRTTSQAASGAAYTLHRHRPSSTSSTSTSRDSSSSRPPVTARFPRTPPTSGSVSSSLSSWTSTSSPSVAAPPSLKWNGYPDPSGSKRPPPRSFFPLPHRNENSRIPLRTGMDPMAPMHPLPPHTLQNASAARQAEELGFNEHLANPFLSSSPVFSEFKLRRPPPTSGF